MRKTSISDVPLFWKPEYNDDTTVGNIVIFKYNLSKKAWKPQISLSGTEFRDSNILIKGLILDKTFVSPFKATFGGFLSTEGKILDESIFVKFLEFLQAEYGITKLEITLPPSHLLKHENLEVNNTILSSLGESVFIRRTLDVNQVINVVNWTPVDLSKGNRKKLRQCNEINIVTRKIQNEELVRAYEILDLNRKSVNSQVSISFKNLTKTIDKFPRLYNVFGTYLNEEMIATAVTVETFPNNLYVYMWADVFEYRYLSPLVSTALTLIDFAKDNSYEYLDLGTSSIQGEDLIGVKRFKSNLGAIEYGKTTVILN